MMSFVAKRFDDAKAGAPVRLFKSHRAGIADGEQKRDFIYVDDAVAWYAGCSRRLRFRGSSMSVPARREASAI